MLFHIEYYFYLYGFLFTAISLGFYFYDLSQSTVYSRSFNKFLRFVFTLSTGWLLVTIIQGLDLRTSDSLISFIYGLSIWVFPPIFFVGFNIMLNHLFKED
ncbi:hypothetical protein [Caldalkalibacillus salinus]|uniref:hypothetical protein n=1 Tax=Caldalkalibacillus salinus TaxID=2803787 RepID=UPI001920B1DB|nr:hypothetical protein [Caldalkalibacillus salinus]